MSAICKLRSTTSGTASFPLYNILNMKRFHLTKVVPPLCFAILAMSIIVSCHKRKISEAEGIYYISRGYDDPSVDIPSRAAAALIAGTATDGSFSLAPGKNFTIVCAVSSDFKSEDCLRTVIREAKDVGSRRLREIRKNHEKWWRDYWNKSYVSIPDPVIEKQYYLSLYGMASCSRDPDFPPPLFGTWITQEPPYWMADYHLNYNFMAPFYALYSANRIEQAEPYEAPLLAAIPRGKWYSEKVTGIPGGIMLPVGIGPLGIETTRWSESLERNHKDWLESQGQWMRRSTR